MRLGCMADIIRRVVTRLGGENLPDITIVGVIYGMAVRKRDAAEQKAIHQFR